MTDQEQPFPIEDEDAPTDDTPTEGELAAALADMGERDEDDEALPAEPPSEEELRALYGDEEPENLPGPRRLSK